MRHTCALAKITMGPSVGGTVDAIDRVHLSESRL
jgi:hypothetical protein